MREAASVITSIKSEVEDYYANDDIYNINSWGADLSFRELIHRYDDNELVKPELQRKYVWDKTEASRFIDSILLGLPVPSIFLAKQPDEKMLIIDGYQRIMTVYDYVRGIFSTDEKVFKLSRSKKVNKKWRGKAFAELSEADQRRIKNTTIHAIIFVQVHPEDNDTGMYQVFERINTTGRTLYPQEIRNCVYHGNLNQALFELNEYPAWRKLFGLARPDPRMRDMEFILRFIAMRSKDFRADESTSISLKKFLNEFMGDKENNTEDAIEEFEDDFTTTVDTILELFGKEAFNNLSKKYPDRLVPKFNPTIFDSVAIATAIFNDLGGDDAVEDLNQNLAEKRLDLLRNETYQNAIRYKTTDIIQINTRLALALDYLFGIDYYEQ